MIFGARPRVVMFAALLVGLSWTSALSAQTPYAGKYAKDAAFQRFLKDVPKLKQAALDRAKRRLGIVSPDGSAITIEVKDAIAEVPETLSRFTDPAFQTETVDAAAKKVKITFYAEFIVSKRFDPAVEMNHEMVHAVMRQVMTPEAYAAMPKWVREGLAVAEADQTEERLIRAIMSEDAFNDPGPVIEGLGTGSFSVKRYGEAGAAMDILRKKGKDPTYERFVAEIVKNGDVTAALSNAYNLELPAFLTEARAQTAQRVTDLRPNVWDEYLEVKKADKERRYEDVQRGAERLLAQTKTGPLVDRLLYMHGKACRLSKQPLLGKVTLSRLVNEFGGRSDFYDEGLYQLGAIYAEVKDAKSAAQAFEKCVRDCPDASVQQQALLGLITALVDLKEKERAKTLLALHEKSFAGSAAAEVAALKGRIEGK